MHSQHTPADLKLLPDDVCGRRNCPNDSILLLNHSRNEGCLRRCQTFLLVSLSTLLKTLTTENSENIHFSANNGCPSSLDVGKIRLCSVILDTYEVKEI